MDKCLFRYIWRYSSREQLVIFAVILASLPFYFWSLDLPKSIVNDVIQAGAFKNGKTDAIFLEIAFTPPAFLGNWGRIVVFPGITVDQLGLLLGLSLMFLVLVLINGAFKYWINVAKGALGERMLRRLRFDLFAVTLRFTPNTLRTVKASETATIIKDEVEPIGGFIGDAFVQPLLLGTQALTAMVFILMQNVWLGLLAGAVVGVQFTVIPRMRRIQLRLGKKRQIASRRLAGRIGEIVDGMEAVHVHNATRWERAEIGERLYYLFDLRFRIYKWKFMVKFLNNLLAQITPFFFYVVGGYLALKGHLDIGQLVAVIGAYRDLPPPLKELIDWDQQRLDVQIKYDQIIQQFLPDRLLPPESMDEPGEIPSLDGPVAFKNLHVLDAHGGTLLEGVTLAWPYPARVALVGDTGPGPGVMARVLGRRIVDYGGSATIAGNELSQMPDSIAGRRVAYVGSEPILFPGTLRDNLVYGLRYAPRHQGEDGDDGEMQRILEAKRTGNPSDRLNDDWIDYQAAGVDGDEELDVQLIEILTELELADDVYRFGLSGLVDLDRQPELEEQVVEARHLLRAKLAEAGLERLVEPFDIDRYNRQASIGENLLFGASTAPSFSGRGLVSNPLLRAVLDSEELTDELVELGARIAETMTEIFRDLPPGHPLFDQFSFIAADDLQDYEDIMRRRSMRGTGALSREDRTRLLALPFDYIEPRHRLGFLNDKLRDRIVAARRALRDRLKGSLFENDLVLYDPDELCSAAPLRDNLLFGRVAHDIADAPSRITTLISEVVDELGLRQSVEVVGLGYQVGPAGRLLTPQQRAGVALGRCIVKRPDHFILNNAMTAYGDAQARRLLARLLDTHRERCIVAVMRQLHSPEDFDVVVEFDGAGARIVHGTDLSAVENGTHDGEAATDEAEAVGRERGSRDKVEAILAKGRS
ncbi:ABC transporter ATP-binding protein/permease [Chelatococcus asaccharovorans]|uniref:ABC transporter ATP-binding protein/permease n=1 Tax=Chelatococcus asaccharovorans TaxID=28210 RepID=UPI00224C66D7|nr:ABC transporter ATP-binding protein/permease [Chelatococcus asaccharovorans]CAH1670829.1 putative ABC transport system ATP-binding protein [Chelatococcus asaccharovorans]CAH1677725.1 putative ABC transport system ATP-binding protein [Chelatococcus asaccharovorans]